MGQSGASAPIKKFVRVTGIRNERFVEFEFSINDSDLTVELILPPRAFDEFCTLQEAIVLPSEAGTVGELEKLAWRERQPGLLRRVSSASGESGEDPTRN